MKFLKMHGIRNDYIYLDAVTTPSLEARFAPSADSASSDAPPLQGFPPDDSPASGAALIRAMSDRHTGVGSDGVILVCAPVPAKRGEPRANVRMRMFNADGSESEMCGNGVRCVAKFAHDRLGVNARPMLVQTGAGVLSIDYRTDDGRLTEATVDMGEPVLAAARIPVIPRADFPAESNVVDVDVSALGLWNPEAAWPRAAGVIPRMTCVSMGNPHVVFFCDDLAAVPLAEVGPRIETHPAFPRRVNVHFVQILANDHARMITWERGAGATLACGTGACAVLVAAVLNRRLSRAASLDLPGGRLHIRWDSESNHVFMTGPAQDVFEGQWPDHPASPPSA